MSKRPPFDYSAAHIGAVETAMSTDRLQRYIAMAGGDRDKGFRLYERNTQLSEALYGPLQGVEIVLRNALNVQLVNHFGAQWYDLLAHPSSTHTAPHLRGSFPLGRRFQFLQQAKIDEARDKLQKRGKAQNTGAIVAELSFGFWVSILARDYHWLWIQCLHRPFKSLRLARATVSLRVDDIRVLRNRIAHHEPILSRNLAKEYADIMETIEWLCGTTAAWVETTSCFLGRFAAPLSASPVPAPISSAPTAPPQ